MHDSRDVIIIGAGPAGLLRSYGRKRAVPGTAGVPGRQTSRPSSASPLVDAEPMTGIEPAYSAWEVDSRAAPAFSMACSPAGLRGTQTGEMTFELRKDLVPRQDSKLRHGQPRGDTLQESPSRGAAVGRGTPRTFSANDVTDLRKNTSGLTSPFTPRTTAQPRNRSGHSRCNRFARLRSPTQRFALERNTTQQLIPGICR